MQLPRTIFTLFKCETSNKHRSASSFAATNQIHSRNVLHSVLTSLHCKIAQQLCSLSKIYLHDPCGRPRSQLRHGRPEWRRWWLGREQLHREVRPPPDRIRPTASGRRSVRANQRRGRATLSTITTTIPPEISRARPPQSTETVAVARAETLQRHVNYNNMQNRSLSYQ